MVSESEKALEICDRLCAKMNLPGCNHYLDFSDPHAKKKDKGKSRRVPGDTLVLSLLKVFLFSFFFFLFSFFFFLFSFFFFLFQIF